MKEEFLKIYGQYIKREGSDALLNWLQSSDFFTAPASSRHHLSREGGLCEHSIHVFQRLKRGVEAERGKPYANITDESIAVCGLLHDVCKVDYYKTDQRNVKRDGVWVQEPYYSVNEKLPYGHGEKSVYIVSGFMRLTRDEAFAINWHMGGFDDRARSNGRVIGEAYKKFPLALMLHIADMQSTYLDENTEINE